MLGDRGRGAVDTSDRERRDVRAIAGTAISLLVSRLSGVALGALAWLVATRLFPVEAIGQAAAIVGVCTFIASASLLGLDQTIVRFASSSDRSSQAQLIQGAMVVVPAISFALAALAVPFVLLPALPNSPIATAASVVAVAATAAAASATVVGESALLALGLARAVVACNLLIAIARLVAIWALVLVAWPLYSAYLASWILGIVGIILYLRRRLDLSRQAVWRGIHRLPALASYSLTSYLATTLDVATLSLLPLVILNLTDAAVAGVFQVVWLVASVLFILPTSIARAAFVYQSRRDASEDLKRRVAWVSIGGGVALSALVIVGAPSVLALVGQGYTQGAGALAWFAASTGIVAFSSLRVTEIRVSGKVKRLVIASLVHLVVLLGGMALLLPAGGLTAVGVAWFVSQSVFAVAVSAPVSEGTGMSPRRGLAGVRR